MVAAQRSRNKVHRSVSRESRESKEDLWKDAFEKKVNSGNPNAGSECLVHMTGLESPHHTVFARVAKGSDVTIGVVVESMVEEGWRNVARHILEKKQQVETIDTYPSASQLLELGSVWLVNESAYTEGKDAHPRRLSAQDETKVPNWEDMTLRVHFHPDRFHSANEVDWGKYCKGLLINHKIDVTIGGTTPHVPVLEGMPDSKDGVIVYEDDELGFAVLNKPEAMPVHATRSNHKEDVVSSFAHALNEERKKKRKFHVSVLQRHDANLDIEVSGLLTVSTSSDFTSYFNKQLDGKNTTRKYRCLVCVKDEERMGLLEHFAKTGKPVTHYFDHTAPVPTRFARNMPAHPARGEWQQCQMKITKVGDESFRAACVSSIYPDSIDSSLAHRLWGPDSATPAEDLGIQYVMELEVEMVTARKQQIRGQLAALGFPIVGDKVYGGGVCEIHSHKHVWNRMALQCCEISFMEPKLAEKHLYVPTENKCVFRLNEAWWTEYLAQYEHYHKSSSFRK